MRFTGKGRIERVDRRHRLLSGILSKTEPEILEIRCTPAASVMNLTATGVLSYQAAQGDENFLVVSVNGSGTEFLFQDTGTGVTIDASNVPGSVQVTPNSVSIPVSAAVGSIFVDLADRNDVISLLTDIASRQITVHGGTGDDVMNFDPASSLTVAFGEAGDDYVRAGQAGSFVLGGDGNDSVNGGDGPDSINGGLGDDTIYGYGGNDSLGELGPSPYALPEIYGLLVYTGLDQPLDYVNQLVTFDRDNPSSVNIVGNNGIDPELYYGTGLDFDSAGNMYMTIQTSTDFFYKVDRATGAATLIGGSGLADGFRISDLSWDPVGNRMLATVDHRITGPGPVPKPQLAQIDLATGAVTFLATLDIDDNKTVALSVDTAGNYYILGLYTEKWYKVDRSTYAVTPLASLPFFPNNWQQGATVDWAHNDVLYYSSFYEIDPTTYTNTFYTVNKATGALTTVGLMGLNINPNGSTQYADIAIDPLSDQGYAEPGNDVIYGGDDNDFIVSGTGNDSVWGETGNDLIVTLDGDDYADGGAGEDGLSGGDGKDSLFGGDGKDDIFGGLGDDKLDGGTGNDVIFGEDGNDTAQGGEGDDTITGNAGDDSLIGGTGADLVLGSEGNDIAQGGDGNDSIFGGDGADSLYGDAGADHIDGEADNDHIEGGADGDQLCGDAGEDVIYGYSGNDTILGGDGNDWVDGGTDDDLIGGGLGNDSVYGNAGIDSIIGGSGDDLLNGGDDPDLIFGEEGKDTVLGGNGNDLIYGGEDDDLLYGGTLTTANTVHMPRNTSLASDGNDTILGGNGLDRVDGGNGDNLLDAGDDGIRETVLAGPGNDLMYNHKYSANGFSARFSDRPALDGGINDDLCRGYLVQPIVPLTPANCEDFAAALIPIEYYTGQWLIHGRVLVEYPVVERVPGNRKGFTPPFRGAQPRSGVRGPVRLASAAKVSAKRNGRA